MTNRTGGVPRTTEERTEKEMPINFWGGEWHWAETRFANAETPRPADGLIPDSYLSALHCDRCGHRLGQHRMADLHCPGTTEERTQR